MELIKKVAIVTGSGRGIGKEISLALAKEGCNLVITSDIQTELNITAYEIKEIGVEVLPICLDLTLEKNLNELVRNTINRFNTIDILVNNAAICIQKSFIETTVEDWDRTMNINLRTPFILSKLVINIMKEKKEGYIINISSAIADPTTPRIQGSSNGDYVPYAASKYGIVGLSRALYDASIKENYGVVISTIYPNLTNTEMTRSLKFETELPLYSWAEPDDVSKSVIFILNQYKTCVVNDLVIRNREF